MPPARNPRRRLATLTASAAGLALAGAGLAAPALADPPQGHPHGQPPGQSQERPTAPPAHTVATGPEGSDPTPPTPPGAATSSAAKADRPAPRPAPPTQPAGQDREAAQGEEAPGNAGTVKVHEVGTPDEDRRNEPKVCDFRIVGFGFPADAHLEVAIVGHGGPNAGPSTFEGEVATDQLSPTGDWVVDGPTLEDGMYKLAVENTTAPGGPKQKVFKVDCSDDAEVDDEATEDDDTVDDDATEDDETLSGGVDGTDEPGGPDDDVLGREETRVLGAYLEREPAQVLGTDATAGGGVLPRTGAELLTLAGGAAALVAGGALFQRGARAGR